MPEPEVGKGSQREEKETQGVGKESQLDWLYREIFRLHREKNMVEFTMNDFKEAVDAKDSPFPSQEAFRNKVNRLMAEGKLVSLGKVSRETSNRWGTVTVASVSAFSLASILDKATKPQHINRPPMAEVKAPKIQAPTEMNAVGETVTSVPAHHFSHQDNAIQAKLTSSRDPRNTEGNSMATGVPRQGTEEHTIAQYKKMMDQMEGRLEKAISALSFARTEMHQENGRQLVEIRKQIEEKLKQFEFSVQSAPNGDIESDIANIRLSLEKMLNGMSIIMKSLARTIESNGQANFHSNAGYAKGFMDGIETRVKADKKEEVITLEGDEALEFIKRLGSNSK